MNYIIEKTTTENINFKNLEKQLDNELYEIYGEMQNNYSSHNSVNDLKTIIIYENQKPIGCGCIKYLQDNLGEVKRVFVSSESRYKGVAKIIIKEIEKIAMESNIKKLILQTGSRQEPAITLYKSMNYKVIDNYGPYINDNNSVCMEKII